ncbi:MAG: dihydroxyacetone kinase subunit DhaL [Chloroflexota bacterium]|nr:dihydroxyacetone kinase subunit DhaL [Chloroflexota bacterium]
MMATHAEIVIACLDAALAAILAHEEELGKLDAVAGDGDHGAGMARGFRAACAANHDGTATQVLTKAGAAFSDAAGGASGALVGMFLMSAGRALTDPIDANTVHTALNKGIDAIIKLGKATAGDKTMLDTLIPFAAAYGQAAQTGASVRAAWETALPAAQAGMESTAQMIAKRGRAAVLKDRSLGTPDAGATSMYDVFAAVGRVLVAHCPA